jgi:hypothetical protein
MVQPGDLKQLFPINAVCREIWLFVFYRGVVQTSNDPFKAVN